MDRSILILYGSETGCAQDVAETLGRQARRRRFKVRVLAMDDYAMENLGNEKLVLFVCSTTGQGEEPANMKKSWQFLLKKSHPSDLLQDVDCAVFGLGDSSYRKFNYPGKKLYRRLQQLGANLIQSRGDGDDQHYQGLDGALLPWIDGLWANVMAKYPLPDGVARILDTELLPPSYSLTFMDDVADASLLNEPRNQPGEFDMTVQSNTRMTAADHFQDVRHLVMTNPSDDFSYCPGDVAVVYPENLEEDVNAFLEQMEWAHLADKFVYCQPNDKDKALPHGWPAAMTFRQLFIKHLDIFGVPRRSFFEMLAYFTTNPNHVERLQEFITPEGQDDMWAYCQRPRRTIAEILFDFKPLSIPYDYILDLFPPLQPRSFSIASSLKAHPHTMELCVGIVKYKTVLKKIRRGVLTKWLATLQPGNVVKRVRIVKGTMDLPPSDVPLIAIGPGTGVAPMRSFLEERIATNANDNVLFFGCRHQDKDYHYKDEWETYAKQNKLKVFPAFSRDQTVKVYVQDLLSQQGALVWDMIDEQQCKVVLSGSSGKMPDQVAYALKTVFMQHGGLDAAEAEEYFNFMNKTGQYQEECWS
ncbi:riboflavin synthase domain-like protein [Hesseltinella vesiculosa]|uniref:NADPH-dependent diflavin oxidoreductase 1 n=1 Tax=Hesseltinella vesiculosa TaxID=101127 RepID=A0A1X2G6R3_9FUNG|nr:riboflavin synthase domain-like protein [Hesseltinella vesiculosa]